MNVQITLDQLHRVVNKKNITNFTVSESQVIKIKNILTEETSLIGLSNEVVDQNTDQVTLKNLNDPSGVEVMVITKDTNEPDEPNLQSLQGKKRWSLVPIQKDGETKDYTIVNISSFVTKDEHENYDNIRTIADLIVKLKNDRFFKKREYQLTKGEFKILETLRDKGEHIDRISIQIYYLLYRRSGNIKKFVTKLTLFLPFMKMLLRKGEPLFTCLMEKLERSLVDMDDSLLKSFSDKKENFERLYNYFKDLKSCDENLSIDIYSFFKTAEYLKYEKEFVGHHFKHSPSSVAIDLKFENDLPGLSANEFNEKIHLDKMNSIMKWILTNRKLNNIPIKDLTNKIVDNLSITFPEIVKKDLTVISPIYKKTQENNQIPILNPGDFVEVKFKSFDKPDFLCEFFKPESHNATMEFLVNELMGIDNTVNSSVEVLKLIGILDTAIVNKIKDTGLGESVINSIKEKTAGIIFKDYIYVRMKDIDLEWTNLGYASKPRIAIKYSVKENAPKFRLNIDRTDKEQINTIFWTE
jgi:hypothetical protein